MPNRDDPKHPRPGVDKAAPAPPSPAPEDKPTRDTRDTPAPNPDGDPPLRKPDG